MKRNPTQCIWLQLLSYKSNWISILGCSQAKVRPCWQDLLYTLEIYTTFTTANCQLSTVNCQLSTVNCQLSTVSSMILHLMEEIEVFQQNVIFIDHLSLPENLEDKPRQIPPDISIGDPEIRFIKKFVCFRIRCHMRWWCCRKWDRFCTQRLELQA